MKLLDIQAAIGTAILLLSLPCDANHKHSHTHRQLEIFERRHSHSHNHQRLHASPRAENVESGLEKRGTCAFPTNAGLVAVTPDALNAGWAMAPDKPCRTGKYCPYACPPGQVMAQWNPEATSYVYPLSMDGGLYCDNNGQVSKPFPNKPYCVDGTGTLGAKNNCNGVVSFCQTVLPGDEDMLIPTPVDSWAKLAVPDMSYWAETAAHFYINPPGTGPEEACVWGTISKPVGNWSPYVAGANTVANGDSYMKIAWNPEWQNSGLSSTPPDFGIKIECEGGGCNGLPCSIDPTVDGVGGVTSNNQASGAGGSSFCVVTVPKGSTANVVVFPAGNADGGSSSQPSTSSKKEEEPTPTPTPTTKPTPTPTPTPSSSSTSTSTTPSSTSTSSTSSSSTSHSSTHTSHTSTFTSLFSSSINTTSSYPTADNSPHILFQNATSSTGPTASSAFVAASATTGHSSDTAESPIASETSKKNSAPAAAASAATSFFGLCVAVVAAACML